METVKSQVATMWRDGPIDSALDSYPDGPGFDSRSGHSIHCVIPVNKAFAYSCSRSTQGVGKNEEQLCSATTTDTFPRFTSPEPGNLQYLLVSR